MKEIEMPEEIRKTEQALKEKAVKDYLSKTYFVMQRLTDWGDSVYQVIRGDKLEWYEWNQAEYEGGKEDAELVASYYNEQITKEEFNEAVKAMGGTVTIE